MGRARPFALVLLCGGVTLAGWGAAGLGGFDWSNIENTATLLWNRVATRGATTSSADAGRVGAAPAPARASLVTGVSSHLKLPGPAAASAAVPATDAATVDPATGETAFDLAGVSAAEAPVIEDPSPDSHPTAPSETRRRLVSLFRPDLPAEEDPQPAARPVETLDECLVIDTCIDEYLWSLYERTPKVDTNKLTERIKTTVKTKGKTRTITKTITKYVVANFAWKDPIAAEKVGMSLKEYVIGGMDRGFKLKLFRALRMMDDAGFMPGITSAFRDDYRQSIEGGERQLIPWRQPPRRLRPRACRRCRERQGRDPSAAIRRKRGAVEVDRYAREGARGRAPLSRSRSPACRADRRQGICRQARPGGCEKGRIANNEGASGETGNKQAPGGRPQRAPRIDGQAGKISQRERA
jgi:hypothetical protein